MDQQLQHALRVLQYDPKWLAYGLLDVALVLQQLEVYHAGADRHPEHYRYAAFRSVLARAAHLDDLTLAQYLELIEVDPDRVMSQAALAALARWQGLADDQLAYLRAHPVCQTAHLQQVILRAQLLRQLAADGVTDDIFRRCVASEDACLQRALVERPDLSRDQLAVLIEHGSNRAVRNMAKQKLRRYVARPR